MIQPPVRWTHSELPDELSAVLASADADASSAAVDRVRARLEMALGPLFAGETQLQDEPALRVQSRSAWPSWRSRWFGLATVLGLWSGGSVPPSHGMVESAQLTPVVVQALVVPPLTAAAEAPAPTPLTHVEPPHAPPKPPVHHSSRAAPAVLGLGLAEELRQLAQIRQQLRTAPQRALLEADAHARSFPHGTLGPERELLRIEALLRLGRADDANQLAARVLSAPDSHPYRAQIKKLLAQPQL